MLYSSTNSFRYKGTRVIVPSTFFYANVKDVMKIGLVRVDPYVQFSPNKLPLCLDGILAEAYVHYFKKWSIIAVIHLPGVSVFCSAISPSTILRKFFFWRATA